MKASMKTRVSNLFFALVCLLMILLGLKLRAMADSVSAQSDRELARLALPTNPFPKGTSPFVSRPSSFLAARHLL
jgi:hypothetical protein